VSTSTRLTRRATAALAALLIAVAALPAMAGARPMNGPGFESVEPSTPVETVVRTVVEKPSAAALPIALAGTALIIAIAGTGVAMVRIAPLRQQLRSQH
jgi:hypothetical protein